jgi:ribonucleoside-diphosphate reductase alpha chain
MQLSKYEPTGFALTIFKDRYAIHDNETFDQACLRVAECVAAVECGTKRDEFKSRFYDIMSTNRFSPGGRIWSGAGRAHGHLLNCFVLDIEDSREGWGEALRSVTIISGTGGGVGLSFAKIRPRGAKIKSTNGRSTGSVSLMRCINAVCNELRSGGNRRSALLFALPYWHPDIPEFLKAKLDENELTNANISVTIDDEFLKLVKNNRDVVFAWDGIQYGTMPAKKLWDKIVHNAWNCGDPGIINLGLANEMSNIAYDTKLIATNPCGEIVMNHGGSCDLGAIVLPTHVINGRVNWKMLADTVMVSVRFLDNVIDRSDYPLSFMKEVAQQYRRIGLGVMGLHDFMLKLGVKYSSSEALRLVDKVMDFIKKKAYETSTFLAVEKGSFPKLDRRQFVGSRFIKNLTIGMRNKILEYGIRNCAILTIAPTGTISIVAGVSSGIEPIFSPVYKIKFNKHESVNGNEVETIVHPLLQEFLMAGKSIEVFEGAHDISPEQHCLIQAMCQKHVCNSISKTINLPKDYPIQELSSIVMRNVRHLKGITIYRDGSRGESPLTPVPICYVKDHINDFIAGASNNDCPSGQCSL